MSQINILVATAVQRLHAGFVIESVAARPDVTLVRREPVGLEDAGRILESMPRSVPCALVLVGSSPESDALATHWLSERENLVVLYVDITVDTMVRIGLRNPETDSLLAILRELVAGVETQSEDRVAHVHLSLVEPQATEGSPEQEAGADVTDDSSSSEDAVDCGDPPSDDEIDDELPKDDRPLLSASVRWVHATLTKAVSDRTEEERDGDADDSPDQAPGESDPQGKMLADAHALVDEDLDRELEAAKNGREPLAVAVRTFGLDPLEFRLMLLALAPELDFRFQRCIAFLMEDTNRRVGSLGLYCNILCIDAEELEALIEGRSMARWLVFEGYTGRPAAADEPLRIDPFLAQWLLGDNSALQDDPRVRRLLRLDPWPGASILARSDEVARAVKLIKDLLDPEKHEWMLLDGEDSAGWRALAELGARRTKRRKLYPIRVDAACLSNIDLLEIDDSARRIGRMARLSGNPLIIDLTKDDCPGADTDCMRVFLATLQSTRCRPAIICTDKAGIARLLGAVSYEFRKEPALPAASRTSAMRIAARVAGAFITTDTAKALADQYPLDIDGLEQAMFLARSNRSGDVWPTNSASERLISALKALASAGVSHLVERIEPIFTLDQVVLPADRKQQLHEIVDHVRLASRVLDDWKFREQLPYGRGVAALFFGVSGVGKTMAAMAIARRLNIQILRLDLSRVVSKYIGDTEKNIDRVFTDAQKSGAAILIDEADALFGKRSEVKDAHDRYANIEVAYLLQRMEAYDGLAILTTNMRKNLDPAFMRRLRFVVDFPRPDIEARGKIWRQCLPRESHEVTDAEFNQLARRLDLTGGQIRQATLRAAFIAAAAGEQINLEHIATAVRAELAKHGIPPVDLDLTRIRRAA